MLVMPPNCKQATLGDATSLPPVACKSNRKIARVGLVGKAWAWNIPNQADNMHCTNLFLVSQTLNYYCRTCNSPSALMHNKWQNCLSPASQTSRHLQLHWQRLPLGQVGPPQLVQPRPVLVHPSHPCCPTWPSWALGQDLGNAKCSLLVASPRSEVHSSTSSKPTGSAESLPWMA